MGKYIWGDVGIISEENRTAKTHSFHNGCMDFASRAEAAPVSIECIHLSCRGM